MAYDELKDKLAVIKLNWRWINVDQGEIEDQLKVRYLRNRLRISKKFNEWHVIQQPFASALLSVWDCPFFSIYLVIPDHVGIQGRACSRQERFFGQKNHNNEPNAFVDCLRIPRLKSITLYTFEGPPCVYVVLLEVLDTTRQGCFPRSTWLEGRAVFASLLLLPLAPIQIRREHVKPKRIARHSEAPFVQRMNARRKLWGSF